MNKDMKNNVRQQRGFTIVELLIVIVVIGILAAITIVAFNGIQNRARVATVTTDLSGAAKLLSLYEADKGQYPATLGEANNGTGVKASAGTEYQYTSSASTYCLTATNGTTSYKIAHDAQVPVAGGCAGHGVGGVAAVTNLVPNPSVETNTTSWSAQYAGGAGTIARMTDGGNTGSSYIRQTWTTAPTSSGTGAWVQNSTNGVIAEGKTYTASAYLRPSKAQRVAVWIYWINSSGASISTISGTAQVAPAGSWTRVSVTATAPVGAVRFFVVPWSVTGTGYVPWVAGDYMDADSAMMTETGSVTTYADGTSSNWVWNGTVHGSTSTGPQL
jgi:prepilin-type N-terminal cleavage/methylation domain-containing protein